MSRDDDDDGDHVSGEAKTFEPLAAHELTELREALPYLDLPTVVGRLLATVEEERSIVGHCRAHHPEITGSLWRGACGHAWRLDETWHTRNCPRFALREQITSTEKQRDTAYNSLTSAKAEITRLRELLAAAAPVVRAAVKANEKSFEPLYRDLADALEELDQNPLRKDLLELKLG